MKTYTKEQNRYADRDLCNTAYKIGTISDEVESVIRLGALVAKLRGKAAKYDQLVKDLGVEMRETDGTIWDECKRLQSENKRLEWDLIACKSALLKIRDNMSQIDPATIASIALDVVTK